MEWCEQVAAKWERAGEVDVCGLWDGLDGDAEGSWVVESKVRQGSVCGDERGMLYVQVGCTSV